MPPVQPPSRSNHLTSCFAWPHKRQCRMVSGIFPFLLCTFTLVCNSASFLNSSMHFSFTPSANSEGEAQPARTTNMYQYVSRVTFHPIRTHLFSAMFFSGATFDPPLKKRLVLGAHIVGMFPKSV